MRSADDRRLVSIFDRAVEQTVLTQARTVRGALSAARVTIDEQRDIIEPALDTELTEAKYNVNIFRARPVVVVDGTRRFQVTTAHQTPVLIAQAAGLAIQPGDKTEMSAGDNLLANGATMVMTIQRAQAVEPRRSDTQTITVDEDIDFTTETIKDTNRDTTYRQVKVAGEKGKRTVTYEIEIKNSQETARRQITSVTIKEPKNQIEIVGTKNAAIPYTGGGNKDQWLAASRIPRDQWGYAEWLVQKESGWNPNAKSRSGACGLAQALPCHKVPGNPLDPVNSLNWMHGYVVGRYGSWEKAVAHSRKMGWY